MTADRERAELVALMRAYVARVNTISAQIEALDAADDDASPFVDTFGAMLNHDAAFLADYEIPEEDDARI
jgi:hypothetical protein